MAEGYRKPNGSNASASPRSRARPDRTPHERIGDALSELEQLIVQDLHAQLLQGSPAFFEKVVLRVLRSMGYGKDGEVVHVGGAGDGGIDGVIRLDRLGLQKVGVQAKRWKTTVGRPEVQGFYGALAQRRAHHGVMITTSTFTDEAHEFAHQMSDKLVLVDGYELARLMMEHGQGVTHEAIRVPKLDRDYFEDV